nr:MAG TPA: hypothetical protein [Caudoviricetes sp.]
MRPFVPTSKRIWGILAYIMLVAYEISTNR